MVAAPNLPDSTSGDAPTVAAAASYYGEGADVRGSIDMADSAHNLGDAAISHSHKVQPTLAGTTGHTSTTMCTTLPTAGAAAPALPAASVSSLVIRSAHEALSSTMPSPRLFTSSILSASVARLIRSERDFRSSIDDVIEAFASANIPVHSLLVDGLRAATEHSAKAVRNVRAHHHRARLEAARQQATHLTAIADTAKAEAARIRAEVEKATAAAAEAQAAVSAMAMEIDFDQDAPTVEESRNILARSAQAKSSTATVEGVPTPPDSETVAVPSVAIAAANRTEEVHRTPLKDIPILSASSKADFGSPPEDKDEAPLPPAVAAIALPASSTSSEVSSQEGDATTMARLQAAAIAFAAAPPATVASSHDWTLGLDGPADSFACGSPDTCIASDPKRMRPEVCRLIHLRVRSVGHQMRAHFKGRSASYNVWMSAHQVRKLAPAMAAACEAEHGAHPWVASHPSKVSSQSSAPLLVPTASTFSVLSGLAAAASSSSLLTESAVRHVPESPSQEGHQLR